MKRRTRSLLGTPCWSILLSELFAQQLVQLRRVGLAGGRFHDLAHEKSEQLVLARAVLGELRGIAGHHLIDHALDGGGIGDRKSTRLNSSHDQISYAVFCLKKKNRRLTDPARH